MSKKSYFLASVFRIVLLCVLVLPMVVTTKSEVAQASRSAADLLWYVDPAWSYRKQITIDSSMVSDDLVDFPVLVHLNSDADLASGALPNGDDILFTDSNDVKLSHEIEYYNAGDLVAWVNVPILSSSVDTTLYIYYGNGSAPNQEDPGGVWDSNYVFVQHLEETTGTHYDSTTNANNGTPQSGLIQNVAGKIDGADEFPGTDEFIDLGAPTSLDVFGPNQDFSIFLWVKRDGISDVEGFFASGSNGDNGIYFGSSFQNTDDLRFYSRANTVLLESTSSAIGDTEWHLVGLTADRDGLMHFWVDGASVTSASIASTAGQNWNNGDDTYKIGTDRSESNPTNGLIDEVRLSDIVRDPDWIATEYNNQSDPGGFITVGQQEQGDAPAVSNESPQNGAVGVSVGLSELSFDLNDASSDPIDFDVTTSPDIGSRSDVDMPNGRYSVSVSGLDYGVTYTWYVYATDGTYETNRQFTFTTEGDLPVISNEDPQDGATYVDFNPTLSADITDAQGESVDWEIQVYLENSWVLMDSGTLLSGVGSVTVTTHSIDSEGTVYNWRVRATESGGGPWIEQTYSFETLRNEISFAAFTDTHIGARIDYASWDMADYMDLLAQDIMNNTIPVDFVTNLGDIINHSSASIEGEGLPAPYNIVENNFNAFFLDHLNTPFVPVPGNHDLLDYMGVGYSSFPQNQDNPFRKIQDLLRITEVNSINYAFMRNNILFIVLPEDAYVMTTKPIVYEYVEYLTRQFPDNTTIILSHQAIEDTTVHDGSSNGYRGKQDRAWWSSLFRRNPQIKMYIHGHQHMLDWKLLDHSIGTTYPVEDFGHEMVFASPYSQADWGHYHEEDQFVIFSIAEDQITTRTWENNGAGGHYVSGFDHTWQIQTTYDNTARDWYSYPIFIQDGEIQVSDMKVFSPEMKLELIGTQPMELFYDSKFESDDGWANENVLGFGDDPTSEVTTHLPGITVNPGGYVVFPRKYHTSAYHEDGRTGQPYHSLPVGTTPAAVPNGTYEVTLVARATSGTGRIVVDMSVSDWGTQSQYSTLSGSEQTVIDHEFDTTTETITGIYTVPDDENAWFLQGSIDFPGSNAYEVSEFSIKRVQDTATTDDFTLSLNGGDFTHAGALDQYEKAVFDLNPMDLAAGDGVITMTASIQGNHYGMANLVYQAPILMSRNARFSVDQVNGNDFQFTLQKDLSYFSDTFKMFPFSRKYGTFTVSSDDLSAQKMVSANGTEWIESNTPSGTTLVTLNIEYGTDTATISNESPANFATGILPNPTLSADILDLQGDSVDWQIETNATGPWVIIDSGTLATGEGTITATPTTMGDYDTTYFWRVSVVDPLGSNETVVETYQFTTRPENYAPTIGSETPGDGATHVPLNPELSVDVSDLDGDNMDITFETNASGPWQIITSYTGVGDGLYNATPTNMDQYATPYNWRVTVDDGHTPAVANYSFTTLNEPGSWWDPNWGYRKKITVDHTLVDEDLTNFTVLIDLTDTDLAAHAQAGGGDIAFTNNHGVKLSHEIELYDNGSGDLLAWVEVPFLSSSEDTILYMYFGNPGAADQQDVEGAWDENFVMVHHLKEENPDPHLDSTSNNNDSTDIVVSDQNAAGIVDGADEFDGTDDYIRVSNDTSLQFGDGSFTAETWINPQSAPDTGGARIINDRGTGAGGSNIGYQLKIKNDTGRWRFSDTAIDDATGNYKAYEGTTTYNYGQWHHVVMVYAADNELRLYVDGIPDGTLAVGTYGSLSNSLPTAIGAAISANGVEGTHSQWFDGILDEIRLSDVARSAGWISTSHTNQSDPVSFISLGNLELESGPPEVSNPNPADGATSVSLSLSQLSFDLNEPDGELMDYTVTTSPDVGSDSATGVSNGTYMLSLAALAPETTYTWTVDVTSGSDNTIENFTFTTRKAPAAWWDGDWAYRKEIIIDHTQVSENLNNFPVMVKIDDASLIGLVQGDADDIAFTDDTSTQLDHEIEYYDPATGELVAWVNVPSLSSLEDTYLYMYFGNREATNQQNSQAVWDSDYVLVQHLNETSGAHYDSTSYGNNGTPVSLADQDVVGQIDGADLFDDTGDKVNVGTDASMDVFGIDQDFSMTFWAQRENITTIHGFFSSGSDFNNGIFFGTAHLNENDLKFMSKGNTLTFESDVDAFTNTGWHYIGLTADRDGLMTFYVDGIPVDTFDISLNNEDWNRADGTYKIGTDRSETGGMEGVLDEVRLSGILRSPGWIETSFNNQSDPAAFYTISQEPTSAYAPPTVSLLQPPDAATVQVPVSFGFIPNTYVPGGVSRAQAELWLNVTETIPGEVVYTDNSHAPQRGVIKDGNLVMVEGRDGACYITVREFPGGAILKQGPAFGSATHSNTSVVIEGDVIYGICTNGVLQAWNQVTETMVWQITVGTGGSYYTTSNSMEVYSGHLYVQSADFVIHKINMASGAEVDSMPLDNTGGYALKAHMLIDYDNDRLYALGDSNYYAIDLTTFTQTWSYPIQTAGGTPVPGAGRDTRGGPILINATNSGGHLTIPGGYLTIFTAYPQNGVYAYDIDGNVVWSWLGKPIRAHATYNPNTGLLYVTDATGYTDAGTGLTLPGTVYALDVNDGTEVWTSHGDGTDRFSRPITASGNYLIFKTDNPTSDDFLYVLNATTGDVLAKVPAGGNKGYWCFPPALSGGYVATGGGYTAQGGNVLDIYHIGAGDPVDYYPLHGNLQHTGYVANGLTDLGFTQTTWRLAKTNDIPLVDGVENTIEYDFVEYSLPQTMDWKIKLVQSDNQLAWSGQRELTVNAKWYHRDWEYRKTITIDHWKVPEDLYDFPILIKLIGDDDVGTNARSDGYDILFATQSGVKLNHEIELYQVSSPADLVAWVNVPFVSSTTDTVLYMYYGNDNATLPPQENPADVWDGNYMMVQHLDETSGNHDDSTDNLNHGTTVVVTNQDAVGMIDGAEQFDGADDHVRMQNAATLQFGEGSFTAEAWIYPQGVPDAGGARIVNNRGTGAGGAVPGYQLKIADAAGLWKFKDSSIDDAGGTYMDFEGTNTYAYNQWYHVSMVYEADNQLRFYVNGVRDGLVSVGAYGSITNALPTAIGGSIADGGVVDADNKQFFQGIIDEVRLSNIPRNPGWITAEYRNQSDPDSFYLLGPVEPYSPTSVDVTNFVASPEGAGVQVSWHTSDEIDLLGFNVFRSESIDGDRVKLNGELIHAQIGANPFGNDYDYLDSDVQPGTDYYYWVQIVFITGVEWIGPISTTSPYPIFLPLVILP